MLHSLCATKTLDFQLFDNRLNADIKLLFLRISQNGADTIYDFSHVQSPSKILEVFLYLDMYFMQEDSNAILTFSREVKQ